MLLISFQPVLVSLLVHAMFLVPQYQISTSQNVLYRGPTHPCSEYRIFQITSRCELLRETHCKPFVSIRAANPGTERIDALSTCFGSIISPFPIHVLLFLDAFTKIIWTHTRKYRVLEKNSLCSFELLSTSGPLLIPFRSPTRPDKEFCRFHKIRKGIPAHPFWKSSIELSSMWSDHGVFPQRRTLG